MVKNMNAQNNAFIHYGSKKLMNFLYFTLSGVKLPMTLSSHNYNTNTLSYLTTRSLTHSFLSQPWQESPWHFWWSPQRMSITASE